jgi:hypothetical protein
MVEKQLTPQLITEGETLIRALDDTGVSAGAAFWFYFSDIAAWKLVLAEEKLGPEGPREVYRKIQRTIASLSSEIQTLSLEDVVLTKPDAPIVAVLKKAIQTGPDLVGIRFTNNVVDGALIEDAYIYRLNSPAA